VSGSNCPTPSPKHGVLREDILTAIAQLASFNTEISDVQNTLNNLEHAVHENTTLLQDTQSTLINLQNNQKNLQHAVHENTTLLQSLHSKFTALQTLFNVENGSGGKSPPDANKPLQTFIEHTDWVRSLAVLPDGTFISGSSDKTIKRWNIADTTKPLQTFSGHTNSVNSLAMLPDGTFISGYFPD
jgi:WD40 repeat protein